ncbi:MAG TPA: hypothetical protein VHS97_13585, partial [Isosphaeraceae bacterium]|nr:hypothetical protein [Isosphaeraceae bacterium]
ACQRLRNAACTNPRLASALLRRKCRIEHHRQPHSSLSQTLPHYRQLLRIHGFRPSFKFVRHA